MVAAFSSPASALGTHIYSVVLQGSSEVPPVTTGGSGTCTVILNDVSGFVQVSGSFSGLTSNAILAHIHGPAPVGMNAGVWISLTETGGTSGNLSGSGTLETPGQITAMLNGQSYVNVHSSINPNGEIRGQITAEVPAMSRGWVIALATTMLLGGAFVVSRRS